MPRLAQRQGSPGRPRRTLPPASWRTLPATNRVRHPRRLRRPAAFSRWASRRQARPGGWVRHPRRRRRLAAFSRWAPRRRDVVKDLLRLLAGPRVGGLVLGCGSRARPVRRGLVLDGCLGGTGGLHVAERCNQYQRYEAAQPVLDGTGAAPPGCLARLHSQVSLVSSSAALPLPAAPSRASRIVSRVTDWAESKTGQPDDTGSLGEGKNGGHGPG